ncbi:MAG: THUMP domain-containing protein [archaeon]
MEAVLITHPGLEEEAVHELKNKSILATPLSGGRVEFSGNCEEIIAACHARLARTVLLYLHKATITTTTEEAIQEFCNAMPTINVEQPFKVACERHGNHLFTSAEVEKVVGNGIVGKVDLTEPTTIVCVYIWQDEWLLGIDLCGKDLSKRTYKIMHNQQSIKGSIAYGLLSLAGYLPGMTVLELLTNDGCIAIEAALPTRNERLAYARLTPFKDVIFHETRPMLGKIYCLGTDFRWVSRAKKHAKIAGVEKDIQFSRMPLLDTDLKIEKNSVQLIACGIITRDQEDELFHQADLALTKKGKLVFLARHAPKTNFLKQECTRVIQTEKSSITAYVWGREHDV